MSNDGYYDESLHDDEVIGAGFHEVDEDIDFLSDEDEDATPKKKVSLEEDDEDLDDLLADVDLDDLSEEEDLDIV